MKMRRKPRLEALFLLLVLLMQALMGLVPVTAQGNHQASEGKKTVIEDAYLKVEAQNQVLGSKIRWILDVETKPTKDENISRKVKWQVKDSKGHFDFPTYLPLANGVTIQKETNQEWFTFSTQGTKDGDKQVLQFETEILNKDLEDLALPIQFQMDETRFVEVIREESEEEEENTLQAQFTEEKSNNILQKPSSDVQMLKVRNPLYEVPKEESEQEEVTEESSQQEVEIETSEDEEATGESDVNESEVEEDGEMEETENIPFPPAIIPDSNENSIDMSPLAPKSEDPYKYYEKDEGFHLGIYPKHETNLYGSFGDKDSEHDDIRNYNYAANTTEDNVGMFWVGGDEKFQNGYHEVGDATDFGRANLRKTISPISGSDNQFKVQLDTIGDEIKENQMVDIVLVLDKSSSMNFEDDGQEGTRWSRLKTAVTGFAKEMLEDGNSLDIQMGMAAFGSKDENNSNNRQAYGEIASFTPMDSLDSHLTGFTKDFDTYIEHEMFNVSNAPLTSGTPTFLGVDAGLKLLQDYSRPNAKKIMIVITDGVPTFYAAKQYYNVPGRTSLDQSLSVLKLEKPDGTSSTIRMKSKSYNLQNSDAYVYGNGNEVSWAEYSLIKTYEFLDHRFSEFSEMDKFSIGFNVDSVKNSSGKIIVSEEDIKNFLYVLGPAGSFKADSYEALVQALKNLAVSISSNINHATIVDPISEFYTLNENSVTISPLLLGSDGLVTVTDASGDFIDLIGKDTSDNTITLWDVTLGKDGNRRQGVRLEYTITLNEDYRDGKFYPANEATHISQNMNTNKAMKEFYAVPSARVKPESLQLKILKKSSLEGVLGEGAKFGLWRGDTTVGVPIATLETDGTEQFFLDSNNQPIDLVPGNYIVKELEPLKDHLLDEMEYKFTIDALGNLVSGNHGFTANNGVIFREFTNTFIGTIDLHVLKIDDLNPEHFLEGAEFAISKDGENWGEPVATDQDGKLQFTGLTIGTYYLTEIKPPNGFVLPDPQRVWKFTVLFDEAEQKLIAQSEDGVVNKDNYIYLEVKNDPWIEGQFRKVDSQSGKPLAGAEFEIYRLENDKRTFIGSGFSLAESDGWISFRGSANFEKNNTYIVKEKQAPDGYIKNETEVTIEIDDQYNVKVNGKDAPVSWSESKIPEVEGDHLRYAFQVEIENDPETVLPSTGGPGIFIYFILGSMIMVMGVGFSTYNNRLNKKGGE